MDVVLIACCKTKRRGGTTTYQGSVLERYLPPWVHDRLLEARGELGRVLELPLGRDLGGSAQPEPVEYLPAYQRYSGIVYRRGRVEELYPPLSSRRVLVVSALYGLVDTADPIRDYEAQMSDRLPGGTRISTWWRHQGLGRITEEAIMALRAERVHDLLSKSYRPALAPWPSRRLDGAGIRHVPYDYSGLGSGSSYRRGDDLLRLLGGICDEDQACADPALDLGRGEGAASVQHTRAEGMVTAMTKRDEIRAHVYGQFIEPTRRAGKKTVTIRATEVARSMGLVNRYPNICGALDAETFSDLAQVRLLRREGPEQSSTVTWTFQL